MKKILIFISLLFISLLIGCGNKVQEELMILTNQEKIELLQEMQMPDNKTFQLEAQLEAFENKKTYTRNLNCSLKSYFDLNNVQSLTSYTDFNLTIKVPESSIGGKGSLYLDNSNIYLDINASLKINGTETKITSKEKMDLDNIIDPNIIFDYLDRVDLGVIKDLDPNELADDISYFIELIDVYQKRNQYRFEIRIDKNLIIAAKDYIDDYTLPSELNNISDNSYANLNIYFVDKVINRINFEIRFNMYEGSGFSTALDASFSLIINPSNYILPTSEQLKEYKWVEFFTIFDKLYDLN